VIVSRHDGALRLVHQNEHGRLAGVLARAWGNDEVEAPRPGPSVVTAAARHDEGWRSRDTRVLYDEFAKRPLHFLDIEAGEHIRLYRQGVTRVSAADVYAGLLVGMHWTGLYRSRWSAPGGGARVGQGPEARAAQDRVVRSEQRRWADAVELAWTEQEPRAAFETRIWHNYELLQLWDLLSLFLSVTPSQPGRGSAVPWGPQLRDLDHAATPVVLPAVGTWPGGPRFAPIACVTAPGLMTLDPFPFTEPVDVEVEHVVIPDRDWSRAAAVREVRRTSATATTWRLVPRDGNDRADEGTR
jgi:Protein of unknown function (DUF3891)